MRQVIFERTGGPEVLKLVDRPTPEPAAGQALVRVAAIGVNYVDIYNRAGVYQVELPHALGSEGAGTVERVGPGVSDVKPGDRVAWMQGTGSYASEILQSTDRLVPLPGSVSFEQAAAVLLQGVTAYVLTHRTYPLKPGDRCLVHAAAGGVGLLMCQMARMAGAYVIGTTSTAEKAQLARAAGASEVILYTQQDFEAETRRLTNGEGVQVVYDSVGKTTFDKSLNCLAPLGYMVLFGQSSGMVPPFDIQRLAGMRSLFLTRPSVFAYIRTRQSLLEQAGAVLQMLAGGKLDVRVDRTIPLDRAADAHRALESRATKGKVLLIP